MNLLTSEMKRSLKELDLGLKGELTITSDMEDLSNALFFDQVKLYITLPFSSRYNFQLAGSSVLGQAGLRLAERSDCLVRRPPAEDQRAAGLDLGLHAPGLCLDLGLLQPPVLPDGGDAEHGQEERAAPGPDVFGLRGHQETQQGGVLQRTQGGRLHTRPLYGGGERQNVPTLF